ncbi:15654_t:CDS:1, partial [Gigaspora rosea]
MADEYDSVAVTTAETVEDNSEVATKEEKNQETGYKVFVGNLAFQTSDEQLAEFFNKTGKV